MTDAGSRINRSHGVLRQVWMECHSAARIGRYFARRLTAYPYGMGHVGSAPSSCWALSAQYGSRNNSRPMNTRSASPAGHDLVGVLRLGDQARPPPS